MTLVIDRIEENIVVCEEQETEKKLTFNFSELPPEAKEGDVLIYKNGCFTIDYEMTKNRKDEIKKIFEGLF